MTPSPAWYATTSRTPAHSETQVIGLLSVVPVHSNAASIGHLAAANSAQPESGRQERTAAVTVSYWPR